MIIFMAYVIDAAGMYKVAMYCAPVLSLYHDTDPIKDQHGRSCTLPICSAIICMLLTTPEKIEEEKLMEQLHIARPELPKQFPQGRVEAAGGKRLSSRKEDDERVCISWLMLTSSTDGSRSKPPAIDIQAPGTIARMLTRVGGPTLSSDYNRPLIFLDKLWGTSGCAVVYKSLSSGVVLKLPLQDDRRYFVPHYYGLYEWPGGLALLVSDEGTSLSDLGVKFH